MMKKVVTLVFLLIILPIQIVSGIVHNFGLMNNFHIEVENNDVDIINIINQINESLVYNYLKNLVEFGPRLTGSEKDLELDEETVKSFRERPEQPRFIMYSGSESFTERMTLINVFNSDLKKLPPKIKPILEEFNAAYLSKFPEMKSKYEKPKEKVEEAVEEKQKEIKGPIQNMYGELCKVFMITKAGAEGLSLYNVRTVHIMEPYWNKVLTDQKNGTLLRNLAAFSGLEAFFTQLPPKFPITSASCGRPALSHMF